MDTPEVCACPPNLDSVLRDGKIQEESHRHTWGVSSATQDNAHGFVLHLFESFILLG